MSNKNIDVVTTKVSAYKLSKDYAKSAIEMSFDCLNSF